MTEKEKKIMDAFAWIIPRLTERGKDNLLSFGEGMVCIIQTNYGEATENNRLGEAKQLSLMEYAGEKIM